MFFNIKLNMISIFFKDEVFVGFYIKTETLKQKIGDLGFRSQIKLSALWALFYIKLNIISIFFKR
jgi:hypothetical protein